MCLLFGTYLVYIKFYVLPTQCICVFCVDLRTKHKQLPLCVLASINSSKVINTLRLCSIRKQYPPFNFQASTSPQSNKYRLKDYSVQPEHNKQFHYQSINMAKFFRPIQPSSDQFTNHTESTFNRCVHCGITNVYKSYDNKRCKHLGSHNVHIY